MSQVRQMELAVQEDSPDAYVSLGQAIAQNRCWFCGKPLDEPYTPVYHPPSSLPETMPTCTQCAREQDLANEIDTETPA